MLALASLDLAGPAAPWAALGFAPRDATLRLGAVELRFGGAADGGIRSWTLTGAGPEEIDGLPTAWAGAPPRGEPDVHPNGATRLDHVVVSTPDLARTEAALAAAGLERRRRRDAGKTQQSFYRLGEVILEVVGPVAAGTGPSAFWGLVAVVADVDAVAATFGDRLGAVRDAVQPGRRIATVRREAGLGLPVALMT